MDGPDGPAEDWAVVVTVPVFCASPTRAQEAASKDEDEEPLTEEEEEAEHKIIRAMVSWLDGRPDVAAKLRKMERKELRIWVARQPWAQPEDEALMRFRWSLKSQT